MALINPLKVTLYTPSPFAYLCNGSGAYSDKPVVLKKVIANFHLRNIKNYFLPHLVLVHLAKGFEISGHDILFDTEAQGLKVWQCFQNKGDNAEIILGGQFHASCRRTKLYLARATFGQA